MKAYCSSIPREKLGGISRPLCVIGQASATAKAGGQGGHSQKGICRATAEAMAGGVANPPNCFVCRYKQACKLNWEHVLHCRYGPCRVGQRGWGVTCAAGPGCRCAGRGNRPGTRCAADCATVARRSPAFGSCRPRRPPARATRGGGLHPHVDPLLGDDRRRGGGYTPGERRTRAAHASKWAAGRCGIRRPCGVETLSRARPPDGKRPDRAGPWTGRCTAAQTTGYAAWRRPQATLGTLTRADPLRSCEAVRPRSTRRAEA
jgi:hypothetical protein